MFVSRTAVYGWVVLVLLLSGATAAGAHHSFAMFDTANHGDPHRRRHRRSSGPIRTRTSSWTCLSGPSGVKHWTIELGSTSILMRGGWKFNTIKKGDKVTAVVSPLRSGEPGSLLSRITLRRRARARQRRPGRSRTRRATARRSRRRQVDDGFPANTLAGVAAFLVAIGVVLRAALVRDSRRRRRT